MKCEVIKGFIDREKGTGHNVGQSLNLSEARFAELEKGGYVKATAEDTHKNTKKETK